MSRQPKRSKRDTEDDDDDQDDEDDERMPYFVPEAGIDIEPLALYTRSILDQDAKVKLGNHPQVCSNGQCPVAYANVNDRERKKKGSGSFQVYQSAAYVMCFAVM